jgi:hypothetical protein
MTTLGVLSKVAPLLCMLLVCFACSDEDTLWTETRERQKEQVKRATTFLADLFDNVPENVRGLSVL